MIEIDWHRIVESGACTTDEADRLRDVITCDENHVQHVRLNSASTTADIDAMIRINRRLGALPVIEQAD